MATAVRDTTAGSRSVAIGVAARAAARGAGAPAPRPGPALRHAADALRAAAPAIQAANARDMARRPARWPTAALLDRLRLDRRASRRWRRGSRPSPTLPDPVGRELARWRRPNGLDIARVAVPLGVVGIIYESRPNVTADAGALVPQGRERRDPARRLGELPLVARDRRRAWRRGWTRRACRGRRSSSCRPRDRAAVGLLLRRPTLVDVIVPRGGRLADRARPGREPDPGPGSPRRQLPRLYARQPPIRPWRWR